MQNMGPCGSFSRFEEDGAEREALENHFLFFTFQVVVFDVSRWRDTNRLDAVAAWIAKNDPKNPIYKLGSNPPLVLAVGRDWARLDVRWNCMRGIHRQHAHNRDCWDGAYVRHYPGGAKPWARDAATAAALGWDPATPTACAALVDAARAAPAVSRSRPPS